MSHPSEEDGLSLSEADLASLFSGDNGPYVEAMYEDYVTGRDSVPSEWIQFFDRLSGRNGVPKNGVAASATSPASDTAAPLGIFGLVNRYRTHGHLSADLNPLEAPDLDHELLDPSEFGIDLTQDQKRLKISNFRGLAEGTPAELIASLQKTYCGTFGVEYMEIRDKERRDWLIEQMEPHHNHPPLNAEERRRILTQILSAERFEQFLHKRFLGQKRFSVEGGDALIPFMDAIIEDGADLGAQEYVIAMAHRGRLNMLAHTMSMPYRAIMSDFHTTLTPLNAQGSGDVKYHRGYSSDHTTRSGKSVHLSLCPNPSHLEWVNPVAEGMVRAKQNFRGDVERKQVIPVLIHGDSAFTGQGIVPETLALSELSNYWTGGTIHIIINNQIGFTTEPREYRFTQHPSDTAKVIQAPIFHVNADDPEACVHAAKLAIAFRQRFREDVIIDLVCYRRHGHNEGDDPTFTQPLMYKKINQHTRVGTIYSDRLLHEGAIDQAGLDKIEEDLKKRLDDAMEESQTQVRLEGAEGYHGLWSGLEASNGHRDEETATSHKMIKAVAQTISELPQEFNPHPKIKRLMEQRAKNLLENKPIDWGTGEALAFGSLLGDGVTIRLTGQDAERGTFSHRHAVLHDVEDGSIYNPLDTLGGRNARFIICNSMLSEAAVLGFEYGYSWVDPSRLVVWEAQFGDFANSAQIIIDQFICSAEQKWNRSSGLVMLLPHGFEGQGPEHSSARLERFLQLCAEDNIQVCSFTTPAQYFHALRRQIKRNFRKPLVVMTPKSLLRHPSAVSEVSDFETGQFHEVLDDPRTIKGELDPESVRRVLICTGKVYYTLLAAKEDTAFDDVAIVRLEQIHPFPFDQLTEILEPYATKDFVWVQEEPWNQGAWSFVQQRLSQTLPKGARFRYVGRPESASPATGSYRKHEEEETDFVREAFARRARAKKSTKRS